MVNLLEKQIVIKGKTYALSKMEVWYYVQNHGIVTSIEELKALELTELQFNPLAVAVNLDEKGDLVMYEIIQ